MAQKKDKPMTEDPNAETRKFYEEFYAAIAGSQANAEYNRRLFGKDMGQQGFAEVSHLDHLIEASKIGPGSRVLDLGCGNGKIAEYISDCSGAHLTGIDFIPFAIQQAQDRTAAKRSRLAFEVMDIARLDFPPASFDVLVSVDTLYFTEMGETLRGMQRILKPGGRMAIYYNYSWQPWTPIEAFDKLATHPDRTDLAVTLTRMGLIYRYWDYTIKDVDHARRKEKIAQELRPQFEAEGNLMLFNNHLGEAQGIQQAFAAGAHARYLYLVQLS
jgi:ubiquinone/menaquinone biosynthesis C-methylase UbiE